MITYCADAGSHEPSRARALHNFIDLIRQNNDQLADADEPPASAIGDCRFAGWNVEVDLEPLEPFEQPMLASMLANIPPPIPTLRLELHEINGKPALTVVTIVPGHPEWSGRWVPILSPRSHTVLLVDPAQRWTALLRANGKLLVMAGTPLAGGALHSAANMFANLWRRSVPLAHPAFKPIVGACELGRP